MINQNAAAIDFYPVFAILQQAQVNRDSWLCSWVVDRTGGE